MMKSITSQKFSKCAYSILLGQLILVLSLPGCSSIKEYIPNNFRWYDPIIGGILALLTFLATREGALIYSKLRNKETDEPAPAEHDSGGDIPDGQEALPGLEITRTEDIPAELERTSSQDRSQETSARPKWFYLRSLVIILLLIFVLSVLSFFFSQDIKTRYSNQSDQADFVVSFIVKDEDSMTPIEGARLEVFPSNSDIRGGGSIGSSAIELQFESVAEDERAWVEVEAPGYEDLSKNIVLKRGSLYQLLLVKIPSGDEVLSGIPSPTPRVFPSSGITEECINYDYWGPHEGFKRRIGDNCVVLATWGFSGAADNLLDISARNTGTVLKDGLKGIISKAFSNSILLDYKLTIFDDIDITASPASSLNLTIGILDPSDPSGETGHFIFYHYNPNGQGQLILRHGPYGKPGNDIFKAVELSTPLSGIIKVADGVMSFYHDDSPLFDIELDYEEVALWIGYSIQPGNEMNAQLELHINEK